jgi:hypothetical protein
MTLSNITSKSAEVLVAVQFAGYTFALRILNGETAGLVSEMA